MTRRNLLALLASTAHLPAQSRKIAPPVLPGSGMPFLTTAPGGGSIYLAWVDPLAEKEHALRFSRWSGSSWSSPETIAQGRNWFINWADFPSLLIASDGSMLAHWLTRTEDGGSYGYGIRIARREPGSSSWRQIHGISLEEKVDYAGFLSFAPDGQAAVFLAPPSGAQAQTGHEHAHRKTVRLVEFHPRGKAASERELDADACSCCQTAIGRTSRGLIAAYRDHLPGELRDIAVVRCVDGFWTQPRTLHPDGWKINGCPTEGPTIATRDQQVAIAWLTRAGNQPKLKLSLSHDDGETFAPPLRIDSGNPLGRPSLIPFERDSYLVVWLEKADKAVEIRLRRISFDGQTHRPLTVAKAPLGRASGFPKIAVRGEQILVAWRDERVRAAILTKSQLIEKEQK